MTLRLLQFLLFCSLMAVALALTACEAATGEPSVTDEPETDEMELAGSYWFFGDVMCMTPYGEVGVGQINVGTADLTHSEAAAQGFGCGAGSWRMDSLDDGVRKITLATADPSHYTYTIIEVTMQPDGLVTLYRQRSPHTGFRCTGRTGFWTEERRRPSPGSSCRDDSLLR